MFYHYLALTNQGHYQSGDWFGSSEQDLYCYLQKRNLNLVRCRSIKKSASSWAFWSSVSLDDLLDFCLHMEQLDKVKVPLTEAILILAQSVANKHFKSILLTIHSLINSGQMVSQACKQYPAVFDDVFIQCLAMAENTGNFSQAFSSIQSYLQHKKQHQKQLHQAIRYPLILLGVLLGLFACMIIFVVPHLGEYLTVVGMTEKPLALKTLLWLNNAIQIYGDMMVCCLTCGLGIVFMTHRLSSRFRLACHKIVLSVPFWGQIKREMLVGSFLQTLSILLGEGLEILESIERSIANTTNLYIKNELNTVYQSVRQGTKLSEACSGKVFSPFIVRLIGLGEETGKLAQLLDLASEIELKDSIRRLEMLLAWTQPILVITMGLIILWVVSATIIPLYENLALLDF
ncbi:MAG: type II secretion system F family protein [Alphaproteobacteria bacterium]|nr:type II secretion system F family protein [Alphaproteobacteria bacterium]